jgi:hypothetical protein
MASSVKFDTISKEAKEGMKGEKLPDMLKKSQRPV